MFDSFSGIGGGGAVVTNFPGKRLLGLYTFLYWYWFLIIKLKETKTSMFFDGVSGLIYFYVKLIKYGLLTSTTKSPSQK